MSAAVLEPTTQLALEFAPVVTPMYEKGATHQEKFEAWIAANPWVMPRIERLIEAWLEAGHKRVSLKRCWEVLRYHYGTTTGDDFKVNNNHTSRAARLVLKRHPEWEPFIETRDLRAD